MYTTHSKTKLVLGPSQVTPDSLVTSCLDYLVFVPNTVLAILPRESDGQTSPPSLGQLPVLSMPLPFTRQLAKAQLSEFQEPAIEPSAPHSLAYRRPIFASEPH